MSKDTRVYCCQGPHELPATAEGLLSGSRFVFKDLFDVAGYVTGAGNPKWLQTHEAATATSALITTLLSQGAACAGRVQTDELAYSLNGQNRHYGTPINPAAPACIPGGSSSGSAVAVANGDCDFSLGTDTGGSVRVPASYCGLFGLRPTLGALDLSCCFELAKSFDTAGIFTRDLALMRQIWRALITDEPGETSGKVLYLDAQCKAVMSPARYQRLQHWCRDAGLVLQEGCWLTDAGWELEILSAVFRMIQGFEIIQRHGTWLRRYGGSLDAAIRARVDWAQTITPAQYQEAQAQRSDFRQQLMTHLSQGPLLWAVPTTPAGPPSLTMPDHSLAVYRTQLMGLTSIAGLSGLPQLHLPMAALPEGPCGISLLGSPHQENQLFATGEHMTQGEQV